MRQHLLLAEADWQKVQHGGKILSIVMLLTAIATYASRKRTVSIWQDRVAIGKLAKEKAEKYEHLLNLATYFLVAVGLLGIFFAPW